MLNFIEETVEHLEEVIPVLSLVIAVLAVLFSPLISLKISRKQLDTSTSLAKKKIIAPIRQNWINELREILSELTTTCTFFWTEEDELKREEYHLKVRSLTGKLRLYINPHEEEHCELMNHVTKMATSMFDTDSTTNIGRFWPAHEAVVEQSQKILKLEWERVKNEI